MYDRTVPSEGPAVKDLTDEQAVKRALVECYGSFASVMPIEDIAESALDPRVDEADFKRYFLNQRATPRSKAVDAGRWADLLAARTIEAGERVGFGFDGSISEDATALIGCTADGYLFVPIVDGAPTIWERPLNAPRDWRVPRLEVERAVGWVFGRYNVGLFLADPPKWATELERWAERYGEETVLAFDTNQPKRMSAACDRFATAISEQSLLHDGNELLTAHVLAMARKKAYLKAEDEHDGRTRYVFTKGAAGRKIDAGIAAVLAFDAAMTMGKHTELEPWFVFD
jgi:hypothetical protein